MARNRQRIVISVVGLAAALAVAVLSSATPRASSALTYRQAKSDVLVVATSQGIPQLNPATQTFAIEQSLFPLLWDGLTEFTPIDGIRPGLAASWKPSKNARSWTFNLRHGIKFFSGKELTAQDVVRTVRYHLAPKTPSQQKIRIKAVQTVQARGKYVVVFKLKEPDAILPVQLVNVRIMDLSSLATINKTPNGTGPFRVAEFVPNDHLTLIRNDAYWGKKPRLREIRYVKAADPTAAVTSLRAGDLDVLDHVPSAQAREIVKNHDANIRIVTPRAPGEIPIWEVDTTSPPFDDVRARRALAYATNRDAILNQVYYGFGTKSPENVIISSASDAYNRRLPKYDFDLAKAKQLFDQVGVTKLTFWTVAGQLPELQLMGEILQSDLKTIGITVDIQANEISAWADKFYPPGKKYGGLVVANFLTQPSIPAFPLSFFVAGRCECNWADPAYDSLFNKAQATIDNARRNALYGQLQGIINREVPSIIPLQRFNTAGVRRDIAGIWLESSGNMHLERAYRK